MGLLFIIIVTIGPRRCGRRESTGLLCNLAPSLDFDTMIYSINKLNFLRNDLVQLFFSQFRKFRAVIFPSAGLGFLSQTSTFAFAFTFTLGLDFLYNAQSHSSSFRRADRGKFVHA